MATKRRAKKKAGERRYDERAGEEVRTEMHHLAEGKHAVKNRRQAIAIGLSKARKKGEKAPPPPARAA